MVYGLLLFATAVILFLFGVVRLGAEMQRFISLRMRRFISYAVAHRVSGLVTGIVTTILFQSSSATAVVTVGAVSAGLITFYQSLAILLGADIGTTLTVQLVAWKLTAVSPVIVLIGGVLWLVTNDNVKKAGESIFYFGLIFFALSLAAEATAPFKDNPTFLRFFQETTNPLLGVAVGLVFTALVQASAIPISMLVILGLQGLTTIEIAFPIVLGANIGTTVTAFLAASVSTANARRTALAHLFFKVGGVLVCLVLLTPGLSLLEAITGNVAQQIVWGHILFNLLLTVMFLPVLKPTSVLLTRIFPGSQETLPLWPEYLDDTLIADGESALASVRRELTRGLTITERMLEVSFDLMSNYRQGTRRDIEYIEMVVDNLQSETAKYLDRVSCSRLSTDLALKLFVYSAIVDDMERIADRTLNLAGLSQYRHASNAIFSDAAEDELEEIKVLVQQNVQTIAAAMKDGSKGLLGEIFGREQTINVKVQEAVEHHLERFAQGVCLAEAGPLFVDILQNLERISNHCENIAEYLEKIS